MGLFLTQEPDNENDTVRPHFIYHQKNFNRTKLYCGVICSTNHWNKELKRVERGDKDYKLKNLTIQSLRTKLESIILRYKNNDEVLPPKTLKLELEKRQRVKVATSYSTLPLFVLVEDWERHYMKDKEINRRTKSKTKSVVKDIKDYIRELEKNQGTILLIDNLDDSFCRGFMNWLFNKPTPIGTGLQPHSVSRRFQYLQTFCKWYSDNSKEYHRIKIPRELKQSKVISDSKPPLCFYESELEKIVEFKEFNFYEPKNVDGKIEWIESEQWEKHLTRDRQNRSKKCGVVEFFHDETKYGVRTYTTWEVYKDFLVLLCSVGCRYSDGVNLKVKDFIHKKRSKDSILEGGVEGFFRFYQKKTNITATPRVNEVSFDIYRKYSKGKSKEDYLFPRTERGNSMSDQKFNKHIKQICKVIGLNRRIHKRVIGSKGKEISSESKYLWEMVSSHIGRKTFIKTMVMDKNFSTEEIMKMTGHKSDRVFHNYYSIEEEDLLLKPNSPFLKKRSNYLLDNSIEDVDEVDIDLPPPPKKELTLKEKIIQLQELVDMDIMTPEEFEQKKKELISSF